MRYLVRAGSVQQYHEVLEVLREHGVSGPVVASERRRFVSVDDLQKDVIEELRLRNASVVLEAQYLPDTLY